MQQFNDYLPSNDILALIIALLVFILTVPFVARRLISFLITGIMLFFAIASGMSIINNGLIRSYFEPTTRQTAVEIPKEPEKTTFDTADTVKRIRADFAKLLQHLTEIVSPEEKKEEREKQEQTPGPAAFLPKQLRGIASISRY